MGHTGNVVVEGDVDLDGLGHHILNLGKKLATTRIQYVDVDAISPP